MFPKGGRKGSTIKRLAACLALAFALASSGEPTAAREEASSASPAASRADPIGALLAEQVLNGSQSSVPVVIGLKLSETAQTTRFAIELSDPVDVRVYTLTNPNRVVIDMPDVLWRAGDDARPTGRRAVKSYRYGQFRRGNFRFVVDLNTPVKVEAPQLVAPEEGFSFRLMIDLTPSTREDFVAAAGWPQAPTTVTASAASPAAPSPPASRGEAGKRIVVIDAGHGGIDRHPRPRWRSRKGSRAGRGSGTAQGA